MRWVGCAPLDFPRLNSRGEHPTPSRDHVVVGSACDRVEETGRVVPVGIIRLKRDLLKMRPAEPGEANRSTMRTRIPIFDHDEMLRLFTRAAQQAKEETRRLRKVEKQLRV